MASISEIVNIVISADTRTPTRQGFGIPLILAYHTEFVEQYRTYSALSEVGVDFSLYDDVYRMASAVFSQNPRPASIVVGRLPSAPLYESDITVKASLVAGEYVRVKVIEPTTGTVVALEQVFVTDVDGTASALQGQINGVTGVTATVSTSTITVTPTVTGRMVHIYDLENCTIEETTAVAGYDTELTSLQLVNSTWYEIMIDSASPANVAPVAAWAVAFRRPFFVATNSSSQLTASPQITTLNNEYVAGLYAPNSHEFVGCRWAAVAASRTPGAYTMAFKELIGATARTLTTAEKDFLEASGFNHYQTLAGLSITRPGKMTNGEWIDIVIGTDALEARIQEDVYGLLAANDKVPYTALGLDMVSSVILAALRAFEGNQNITGLLAQNSSEVIVPNIKDVSATNKSTRQLTGVRFTATYEGAIHYVSINGSIAA